MLLIFLNQWRKEMLKKIIMTAAVSLSVLGAGVIGAYAGNAAATKPAG